MGLLAWHKLNHWSGVSLFFGAGVAIAYVAWGVWESQVSIRDSRDKSLRSDRWTLEAYALSQGSTALTALAFNSSWPFLPDLCAIGGASLFGVGVILRISAVRELGEFYSHRVRLTREHRVVQTGPYKWLRHPAYSGMLIAHLGLALVFFNWVSFTLLLGALLPAIVVRILVEERTLVALPEYAAFCQRRARLIPLVW
jgi:protein-S-isoprenylcysteine O-methyltransferase Ste14